MSELIQSNRGLKSFFLSYILRRIERNKNFLCVICGPTGSGKSFSAIRIGEILDPEFNKNNIVFNSKEFMRLINSGDLKTGSVVVFDEAGVGLSALEWQSLQNKLINYVLQTFRHKNYIVLFTTPHMGFFASQNRKLLHAYIETVGIDTKKKVVHLKPLLIQVNQRRGEPYFKFLRVLIPGRGAVPVKRLQVGLPSKLMLAEYEQKKNAYTQELNDSIERDLNKDNTSRPLTDKQAQVIEHLRNKESVQTTADKLGKALQIIYTHMEAIKRKGWKIVPVHNGHEVLYYDIKEPKN